MKVLGSYSGTIEVAVLAHSPEEAQNLLGDLISHINGYYDDTGHVGWSHADNLTVDDGCMSSPNPADFEYWEGEEWWSGCPDCEHWVEHHRADTPEETPQEGKEGSVG